MAFESQVKKLRLRGRGVGQPIISFRMTTSGSTGVHVSKATCLSGERIDIEIDEERKMLRVGLIADGFQVSKTGSFSCSKRIFRTICPNSNNTIRVPLELHQDGLWYGSYSSEVPIAQG